MKPRHAREVVDALTVKMKAGDLAPRSLRHAFFAVRTMFEHAVTLDEQLASNPCVLPKGYLPGKQDRDPTWRPSAKFTHAEVEQLIEDGRVPEDWRAIHATLFLSGAPFGELAALTIADYDTSFAPLGKLTLSKSYDFKGKRLKSTKTGRAREVPVHATLAEVLDAWIKGGWERFMGRPPKPSDLLFPSGKPHLTHGQFRNNNLALKQFHRYCELLGIRTQRIHDSRRSFISLARDDGAQRDVIKSLTHPLDNSDAHDSYTTFAWSRCCEEVAKLKIGLRKKDQPATVGAPAATPMDAWTHGRMDA